MLSERQTPGFKSPWGQQIGGSGKSVNDEEADEPVFIDKMPWVGDGGDRVRIRPDFYLPAYNGTC